MARIVEHLPIEELEARYRAARDVTEARHYQAIWLLAQGRTVLQVAEVLAFVPRWAERLAARPNACGPGAPGDRRRRNGRAASLLTPEGFCQGSWQRACLVGRGTAGRRRDQRGVGAWDGLRVLRLGGGGGAAGAHRPGLPPVPLPRLWPAVQR